MPASGGERSRESAILAIDARRSTRRAFASRPKPEKAYLQRTFFPSSFARKSRNRRAVDEQHGAYVE